MTTEKMEHSSVGMGKRGRLDQEEGSSVGTEEKSKFGS